MLDADDLINYELCFPGAVTGSTEVECPHCGELLTARVNDPMGEESYQCTECSGAFEVDWGEGQVRYDNKNQTSCDITLDDENDS